MTIKLIHPDRAGFPSTTVDPDLLDLVVIGTTTWGFGFEAVPLAMNADRRALALVDEAVVMPNIGEDLWNALEDTCSTLWGPSWNIALVDIFGLNRRTVQRQRVIENLLPPRVLQMLSYIASADDAKLLAQSLRAYAGYRRFANGSSSTAKRYWDNVVDVYERLDERPPAPGAPAV